MNDGIAELMDLLASVDDHPWNLRTCFQYIPANYEAVYLPCDFQSLLGVEFFDGFGVNANRVPMNSFMQYDKNSQRRNEWKIGIPPRYRLGVHQGGAGSASKTRGTAYLYFGYPLPAAIDKSSPDADWTDCVAQSSIPDDPYVEPPNPHSPDSVDYYGRIMIFDRPSASDKYMRLTYQPVAPELSADTDVFIDYTGWADYVVITAAIKMMSKEESSTEEVRMRKLEARDRIMGGGKQHDSGAPQRSVDRSRYGGDPYFDYWVR